MDARLEEIKARAQAATSGPWVWHQPAGFGGSCYVRSETDRTYRDFSYIAGDVSGFANCDFIAHSRSDIEYLTARLTVLAAAQERFASLLDCLEPRLVAIVANRTGDIGACTQEPDGCSECLARECLAAVATARAALGAER